MAVELSQYRRSKVQAVAHIIMGRDARTRKLDATLPFEAQSGATLTFTAYHMDDNQESALTLHFGSVVDRAAHYCLTQIEVQLVGGFI